MARFRKRRRFVMRDRTYEREIDRQDWRLDRERGWSEWAADWRLLVPLLLILYMATLVLGAFLVNALTVLTGWARGAMTGETPEQGIGAILAYGFQTTTFALVVYAVALSFVTFGVARWVYTIRRVNRPLSETAHGTERFSETADLADEYRAVPETGERFSGRGGFPVSRRPKKGGRSDIYIEDDAYNFLIYGTTRSGKGETAIFPSIDLYSRAEEQASMVIHDPKGELFTASKETLEARGYNVRALNLADPARSMAYNPLGAVIRAYREAVNEARDGTPDLDRAVAHTETVAFTLFYDPKDPNNFWTSASRGLAKALILAVCEEASQIDRRLRRLVPGRDEAYYARHSWDRVSLYQVAKMLERLGPKEEDPETGEEYSELDAYFDSLHRSHPARTAYSAMMFAEKKARGGVFVSTLEKLQTFTSEQVAKMMSLDTGDLTDVGFDEGRPTAVFLIVPDYDRKYHVIASLFIKQLYFLLVEEASRRPGQRCARQVVFILDEFGNMPPIEGLESIVTVCLSRNIRFHLYLQAYGQLVAQYNEHIAKTVAGNCGYQVFIHSADYETCQMFSNLLGSRTETTVSRQGELLTLDKSFSESTHGRPLMTPNELMHILEGEWVVFRPLKRKRLDGSPMFSYPILNKGETRMRYRYEYLSAWFDPSKRVGEIGHRASHADRPISDLMYVPASEYVATLLADGEDVAPHIQSLQADPGQGAPVVTRPHPRTETPETKVGPGHTPPPEEPAYEDWMTKEQQDLLYKEYMDRFTAWRTRRVYDGPVTRFERPADVTTSTDTPTSIPPVAVEAGATEAPDITVSEREDHPESPPPVPSPTHGTSVPATSGEDMQKTTPEASLGLDLLDDTFGMTDVAEPISTGTETETDHEAPDEQDSNDLETVNRTMEEWIELKGLDLALSKRIGLVLMELGRHIDIGQPVDERTMHDLIRPYLIEKGDES